MKRVKFDFKINKSKLDLNEIRDSVESIYDNVQ